MIVELPTTEVTTVALICGALDWSPKMGESPNGEPRATVLESMTRSPEVPKDNTSLPMLTWEPPGEAMIVRSSDD